MWSMQWGAVPLEDNVPVDSYYYQLAVYTGVRKGAGTKSKPSFLSTTTTTTTTTAASRCSSSGGGGGGSSRCHQVETKLHSVRRLR